MPGEVHSMTPICNRVTIRRSATAVFDHVTTPATWAEWNPQTIGVRGDVDHPLGVGARLVEEFFAGGLRGRMSWVVRRRDAPHCWRIEGEANIGCRAIITYLLSEGPAGTLYEREFCYWKPRGFFFGILDRLFSRWYGRNQSERALQRLKGQLEADLEPLQSESGQRGATSSPPPPLVRHSDTPSERNLKVSRPM